MLRTSTFWNTTLENIVFLFLIIFSFPYCILFMSIHFLTSSVCVHYLFCLQYDCYIIINRFYSISVLFLFLSVFKQFSICDCMSIWMQKITFYCSILLQNTWGNKEYFPTQQSLYQCCYYIYYFNIRHSHVWIRMQRVIKWKF